MERTGCSTRACQGRSTWKSPSDGWLLFSTWDVDIFSMACPAGSDPWVLSSHIPVLASCCSLTKLNPPLKVPDALGPHTCLAPLGTCSPCPHTCSAPVMALQTWDSSYAPSFHCPKYFVPTIFFPMPANECSGAKTKARVYGTCGTMGLLSESCPWRDGCGNWLLPPGLFGGLQGKYQETPCSWKQHTQLLLMAVADCSPGGHHCALTVPCTWSCMHHTTHTPSLTHHPTPHPMCTTLTPSHMHHPHLSHVHCPTHPACPQHTHSSQAPVLCGVLVALFLHMLSTSKPPAQTQTGCQ